VWEAYNDSTARNEEGKMKRIAAFSAAIVLACLWALPIAACRVADMRALFAAAPPVEVTFAVAKQDIQSWWKKSWPAETILEINAAGEGTSSVKVINLRKVPYYSVPAKVKVKRANGTVANFSISVIYKKPAEKWIFEDVATGNVQQEKASGQEPPPFAEAEAMIRKGWMDKFTQEGHKEINILKVHPNPAFKAYGKRFWFTYRIDVDYNAAYGNTRYECKGQEVELKKENAEAPWVFGALLGNPSGACQGRNLK